MNAPNGFRTGMLIHVTEKRSKLIYKHVIGEYKKTFYSVPRLKLWEK